MVSEELVKIYLDHLKISISPNICEINQPSRSDETKNKDYNWEELLLSGGLKSLYVFELDTHLKKKPPVCTRKKIEK